MNKKLLIAVLFISAMAHMFAYAANSKENRMKTVWADKVTSENVWQSYPRPQLQRSQWINLNGLWQFAVTSQDTPKKLVKFEEQILVPFAIESSLSGVQRPFLPTEKLWYQRHFTLDDAWKGKNVILHFGAVDYECQVWVNNKLAGTHKGGNNPFSFDVTKFLKKGGSQLVEVAVIDPTDTESISRGKQQLDPKGIWYSPVSGIWQTVWLEAVSSTHILQVHPTADVHKKTVSLDIGVAKARGGEKVKVELLDGGKVVNVIEQKLTSKIEMEIPEAVLWSPSSPKLYHLNIELVSNEKVVDKVKSYFAPSEEAMLWDMVQLKKMGFNTIRKHIKIEPEQYYYYADSLGLMMWQDMVSGFSTERKDKEHIKPNAQTDWNAPVAHTNQWQQEMFEMINRLRFYYYMGSL